MNARARIIACLAELPDADLDALARLVEMLPTKRLAAELAALDAAQMRPGDTGSGSRPPDGAYVVTMAQVLRTMRALGGGA